VANEDQFPGRVTRAQLTDADRAMGYTAGIVTAVDARGLAVGYFISASIDGRLDWRMPFAGGLLRTYGSVTRQLRNRQAGPFEPTFDYVGFHGGPLTWRANGGAEWTRGRTMIGANLQYFSRYRLVSAELTSVADIIDVPQGSKYIKAQTYLVLYVNRRFTAHWAGRDRDASLDFGVVNLFNHAPPYDYHSYNPASFSLYGDPPGRRFELTLNAGF
jgi:iron complex outermembrane receptor protein